MGERGRKNRSQTRVDRAASETEESGPKKRPARLSSVSTIDGAPSRKVYIVILLFLFHSWNGRQPTGGCVLQQNLRKRHKRVPCGDLVVRSHVGFLSFSVGTSPCLSSLSFWGSCILSLLIGIYHSCLFSRFVPFVCRLLDFRPCPPAVDDLCRRLLALRFGHPRLAEDRRGRQEQQRQRNNSGPRRGKSSTEGEEEMTKAQDEDDEAVHAGGAERELCVVPYTTSTQIPGRVLPVSGMRRKQVHFFSC